MDFDLRPATKEETRYMYKNSQQISSQCGLIGHLRADMDTNGTGFFSTWFGFRDDLKTQEFKDEFDEIINGLRFDEQYGGALASRDAMRKFCWAEPASEIAGNYTTEYGFRAETEKYAYLLRMIPVKGDYNLYCYCYRRDWLDRHMEQARRGIRFIDSGYNNKFKVEDGDKVRITTRNGETRDRIVRYIDDYHMELDSGLGDNLYHICEFAEHFEKMQCRDIIPLRQSLPEQCYSVHPETGKIILLTKGERGYAEQDYGKQNKTETRKTVDELNRKMGVTKAQEEAMKAGSLFGFACPAADPKSYDENGKPVKSKTRNRSDAR